MPKKGKLKGFEELSPERVGTDLFGHLHRGDKVALTSRIQNLQTQEYVDALSARGLQVRLVTNQTGVEDFCFLASAKKELAGMTRSTYVGWAGILGNASKVWSYSIDSEDTRNALGQNGTFLHHSWKNPLLRNRIEFVSFTQT